MDVLTIILTVGSVCSAILTISGFAVAFVRPIRLNFWNYVQQHNNKNEAVLCTLRNDMTLVYNKYADNGKIKITAVDWASFMSTYACYHALGGNLSADSMFEKIRYWDIVFPNGVPDSTYYKTLEKLKNSGIKINMKNVK